jgi:DNA-directed RNA polymerase specialized sigma24 family protein
MNDPQLRRMALEQAGGRCMEENSRYTAGKENDSRFCYELFRRALLSGDQDAWTLLYYQFEAQVAYWVRRDRLFPLTGETADYFVNDAYMRMFKTLKWLDQELFDLRFPGLGSLLAYLKRCASSSVRDAMARAESYMEVSELSEQMTNDRLGASDPTVEAEYQRELWGVIERHLLDDEERNVFYDSYVLELKAPEIQAKYPGSFTDVMEVFRIRARILRRLRKDPRLERFIS